MSKTLIGKRIGLVLFGLFLCVVVLEAGLRIGGFIILSLQEHRNTLSIRQKGAYRLLCLGESTTQGQYPVILEQILNQQSKGIKFSVIDKGFIGTTSDILSQLEKNLDNYMPDMVIAMMGINDSARHMPFQEHFASRIKFSISASQTYKLIKFLWLRIKNKTQELNFCKQKVGIGEVNNITLKLNFGKDKPYLELGNIYNAEGDYGQAETAFKQAIEINPQNYDAYIISGLFYLQQGDYDQATAVFKQAVELNATKADAYIWLGVCYKDQGKYNPEELFNKAIQLNPKGELAYLGLGQYFQEQGRYAEAKNTYEKAIQVNPSNPEGHRGLGWCYHQLKDYDRAEAAFKKVIELAPESNHGYAGLVVLYGELGNYVAMQEYSAKLNNLMFFYKSITKKNYYQLKKILDQRGIKLVCVQYPMCSIKPLKRIFEGEIGIIFVDNEKLFKEALRNAKYEDYFIDNFAGAFGHCTEKGNRLLAENIANIIQKEFLNK